MLPGKLPYKPIAERLTGFEMLNDMIRPMKEY